MMGVSSTLFRLSFEETINTIAALVALFYVMRKVIIGILAIAGFISHCPFCARDMTKGKGHERQKCMACLGVESNWVKPKMDPTKDVPKTDERAAVPRTCCVDNTPLVEKDVQLEPTPSSGKNGRWESARKTPEIVQQPGSSGTVNQNNVMELSKSRPEVAAVDIKSRPEFVIDGCLETSSVCSEISEDAEYTPMSVDGPCFQFTDKSDCLPPPSLEVQEWTDEWSLCSEAKTLLSPSLEKPSLLPDLSLLSALSPRSPRAA